MTLIMNPKTKYYYLCRPLFYVEDFPPPIQQIQQPLYKILSNLTLTGTLKGALKGTLKGTLIYIYIFIYMYIYI